MFKRKGVASPSRKEIIEKVRTILVNQLHASLEEITMGASLVKDLRADELDSVEIPMVIEKEFDIEIPDEDTDKLFAEEGTVGSLIDYVEKRLTAKV